MPELPEVEVTRKGLIPLLSGRTITTIRWSGKQLRQPIDLPLLRQECLNRRIQSLDRRAKNILIRLDNMAVLRLHLGMTGKLAVVDSNTHQAKHDHLFFTLDNGQEFRFNDVRRFGLVEIWPSHSSRQLERSFSKEEGLEPLSGDFQTDRLKSLASKRRVPIKAFLMNRKLIAGIGNIYANEALFLAGINPHIPANRITQKQWHTLRECCIRVLNQAIEAGGTTIYDFLATNGQPGYFQLQLNVYGREDAPCPRCQTEIKKSTLVGRATFHCPRCQPAPKG
ncbi:MAG: formamidopyrimidine-DNA glycosylase [Desulfobulbus propionicus]|nr:MAG: formamidopyrimidine-DNA glycosylase [Desulfobulbus propionicus]